MSSPSGPILAPICGSHDVGREEKSDMDMVISLASSDELAFILGASSLPIRFLRP
jgi:hypothetical protein